MKKQLFLMSALALTALTSCGGGKTEKLKVGLICLHGETSTYDKNFMDAFNKAVEVSKEKGYIETSSIRQNIDENEACQTAAEQLADDGYRLIFTDSFGHDAFIKKVAADYEDVTFSSATGTQALIAGLSNYHNAFASIYEGRYLAGVAAGLYLKEHGHTNLDEAIQVGYVGAFPYAEVISGYTSWYLGVKSIFPNVTMLVTYTGTWYGETEEKTAAESLIGKNCILISQHADSMGAPNACMEKKIPNVSYNIDTTEQSDKYDGTFVAYSKINWQPYYEEVIKAVSTGSKIKDETGQNWTGTLATNSVQYGINDDKFSDESKQHIKDVENKLKNGSLKVFDTSKFTVKDAESKGGDFGPKKGTDFDFDSDGHLTMFKADIKDEKGEHEYERDTNIVENGVVLESVYRSAPAFDLLIDGITPIQE